VRIISCLLVLCAGVLHAQQQASLTIEGETLSGKKVSLPAAMDGQPALLIVGFT
jgi:hypothetical protein